MICSKKQLFYILTVLYSLVLFVWLAFDYHNLRDRTAIFTTSTYPSIAYTKSWVTTKENILHSEISVINDNETGKKILSTLL